MSVNRKNANCIQPVSTLSQPQGNFGPLGLFSLPQGTTSNPIFQVPGPKPAQLVSVLLSNIGNPVGCNINLVASVLNTRRGEKECHVPPVVQQLIVVPGTAVVQTSFENVLRIDALPAAGGVCTAGPGSAASGVSGVMTAFYCVPCECPAEKGCHP